MLLAVLLWAFPVSMPPMHALPVAPVEYRFPVAGMSERKVRRRNKKLGL